MNTYSIAIDFYSEPNFCGNMSRYWFKSKRGNKISYGGFLFAKRYLSLACANKMAKRLAEIPMFKTANISVVNR
jgi:hypothetical protein